jgi:hypothetical protein
MAVGVARGDTPLEGGHVRGEKNSTPTDFLVRPCGSATSLRPTGHRVILPAVNRVAEFLSISKPNAYCDSCIAQALNLDAATVAKMTESLSIGYDHRRGKCTVCGHLNRVVAAD